MSYLKGIADRINGVEKQSFTQELDINSLVPSQNNFYGIREVEELAESIKENGLMHNLVVRKINDGMYEIISGERRYHALKSLGYEKIPCQVKNDLSDLDAELMLIQANAAQRELTPTEKMEGIKRLESIYKQKRDKGEKLQGKTRDLIGKDLGLSGVQVGRYKKVDKDLIEPLKEKLDKEEITLTQAHTLSSLSDKEQQVIHEEIKDLDPKESKEEIEILVNGIKQPLKNELDKELLNEMHPVAIKEVKYENDINMDAYDIESKLKNAFKEFNDHPRLIISNNFVKGIIYINKFNLSNSILTVGDGDRDATLTIKINCFEKCDEVEIEVGNPNPIKPKILYKISDGIYVWFKRKIASFL